MSSSGVRKNEQIKLIMECRKSGLSDYQWCKTQGIHPGTFYNWVSKLRKKGYSFSESESKNPGAEVKQEVVKVDLLEHEVPTSTRMEQNVSFLAEQTPPCIAAEVQLGAMTLRLFNGADPMVIQDTLKCIGGISHAW